MSNTRTEPLWKPPKKHRW